MFFKILTSKDSSTGLYTSDETRVGPKTAWGAVKAIEFVTKANSKGKIQDYFEVENQSSTEKVLFKIKARVY